MHRPYISACGGTLIAAEGSFTSPNYPGSYPNNAECVWILPTSPGNKIDVSVQTLDIQKEDDFCNNDFLEIRKNNGLGELIGKF